MRIGSFGLVVLLFLAASAAAEPPANGRFANSGYNGKVCADQPQPGLVIDKSNVGNYGCFLPQAAIEVVKHGFKIRIATVHKLDWPDGYKQATEKYGAQVRLDADDNLENYVAGMPFPLVNTSDPKAARKIAYNWHMGPFMPDDFSLTPWGSFAYSDSGDGTLKPIHSDPDHTFICDEFRFLRFAHRTEIDPRPTLGENAQGVEWKARCNNWNGSGENPHGAQSIWLRFLDPRHGDENFVFDPAARRMLRVAIARPYLNHECRGCHQPYWAYALPKTELYSYRLLGTTPILGCLTADDEPAGFTGRDSSQAGNLQLGIDTVAFGEEPFEMRSAYIIEMIPVDPTFSNWRALVWIDTETYVWLGAEFFESNLKTETPELQEVAVPLWRTHPAPGGGFLFDLAGSFYVPLTYQPSLPASPSHATFAQSGEKPWFFRSVVPSRGPYDQKINVGDSNEVIFSPRWRGGE